MNEVITNKVAGSGLITLDLETYLPQEEVVGFNLGDFLFMGLILKEKEFRGALTEHDWKSYNGKAVAVYCSVDAIIPNWAWMLVATYLEPHAAFIYPGDPDQTLKALFIEKINAISAEEFRDKKVVVKGCGDKEVNAYAYLQITARLKPVAKSIMYGEPCSTVPVCKKK